jgi:hypothetical protein
LSQCGEVLNRELYELIMTDLDTRWGFVAIRPGTGAIWLKPPADAYRLLATEVERRTA